VYTHPWQGSHESSVHALLSSHEIVVDIQPKTESRFGGTIGGVVASDHLVNTANGIVARIDCAGIGVIATNNYLGASTHGITSVCETFAVVSAVG